MVIAKNSLASNPFIFVAQLMLLTAIIEMLRLLTPRRMTLDEDLSSQFPGRRILTLARAWAGQPGVVRSWRDVNT